MLKIFKFLWVLTALLYFASLVLSYAFLSESVAISADERGIPDEFITKETFFYTALAIFVVINLLGSAFLRILTGVPASSGMYFRSGNFKENITSWFAGFIGIVNVFLASAAAYIALYNNQGDYQISQFNWLIYVAPVLMFISLVWLVIIIGKR
ncbi:MAG: hypothetical protein ACLFUB_01845 [Cyclobacteriaceae bacterium]